MSRDPTAPEQSVQGLPEALEEFLDLGKKNITAIVEILQSKEAGLSILFETIFLKWSNEIFVALLKSCSGGVC